MVACKVQTGPQCRCRLRSNNKHSSNSNCHSQLKLSWPIRISASWYCSKHIPQTSLLLQLREVSRIQIHRILDMRLRSLQLEVLMVYHPMQPRQKQSAHPRQMWRDDLSMKTIDRHRRHRAVTMKVKRASRTSGAIDLLPRLLRHPLRLLLLNPKENPNDRKNLDGRQPKNRLFASDGEPGNVGCYGSLNMSDLWVRSSTTENHDKERKRKRNSDPSPRLSRIALESRLYTRRIFAREASKRQEARAMKDVVQDASGGSIDTFLF